MPGRMRSVRGKQSDPWDWLDEEWLSQDDLRKYAEMYIVALDGRILGVGKTLDEAWRRSKLPRGTEAFVCRVPPDCLIF